MVSKGWQVELPWPGMPKKRPRVTSNGTYMPKEYVKWKEQIAEFLAVQPTVEGLQGPVALVIEFHKDKIIVAASEFDNPRFGSADLDNLIGAVMDAFQDGGAYANDRQVTAVQARFMKGIST